VAVQSGRSRAACWAPLPLAGRSTFTPHFRTRVSSDHLWRLSKGAQEGAAHAVAIGQSPSAGDDVDRMALCSIIRRAVWTEVLDRLGRRLTVSARNARLN